MDGAQIVLTWGAATFLLCHFYGANYPILGDRSTPRRESLKSLDQVELGLRNVGRVRIGFPAGSWLPGTPLPFREHNIQFPRPRIRFACRLVTPITGDFLTTS
jgi:hypothetical protein